MYTQQLSLARQDFILNKSFTFIKGGVRGGQAVWEATLQPTPLSTSYFVQIKYKLHKSPKVFVLSPELKCRDDVGKIPHLYRDKSLCLYLPNTGEWTPACKITETIVPWTIYWLYFYEIWFATGVWLGGGKHPNRSGRSKSALNSKRRKRIRFN